MEEPTRTTANLIEWASAAIRFRIRAKAYDYYRDTTRYLDTQAKMWHKVDEAQLRYLSPDELTLRNLLGIMQALRQ